MANGEVRVNDCGCCAGIECETPHLIENPSGQPAISYRIGEQGQFKESLLARLSSSDYPALRRLRSRSDDDFTVALCDAVATTLDVLTFYQERIANEHYLRTATEKRSVAAMARLIGYAPSPGVAASSHLAFTLQEAPGERSRSAEPVTIPKGTRVQSVPGPNEKAQVFETVEDREARAEWNAVPAQLSKPWTPIEGDNDLYLQGVATQLQPGDTILIVGAERERDPLSKQWDVRILATVEPDTANHRTRITWADGLGHLYPYQGPALAGVQVFALRQRAALFGHNAPDPNLMGVSDSNLANLIEDDPSATGRKRWKGYTGFPDRIELDAAYPKITAGSWVVLVSNAASDGNPSLPGYVELHRAMEVRQVSRTSFGLSAKITRIIPGPNEHVDQRFALPETTVLAQTDLLPTVARPLLSPVYGDTLELDVVVDGLLPDQPFAVTGKRQRIAVARGVNTLTVIADDGEAVSLAEGDSLFLLESPVRRIGPTLAILDPEAFQSVLGHDEVLLRLRVIDPAGRRGRLDCDASQIVFDPGRKDDSEVMEIAFVASGPDAITSDRDRTVLKLAEPLTHCYERASVRLNANVASATHGETVTEILGNGDAASRDQAFVLRQPPLTYVSADTPSGRASTLELRVNDLLWKEAPSVYQRGANDRAYSVATDEEDAATVRFGDGVEGARLPTGQNNVRARYRKGLGVGGNLAAGKLTNLLSRPLGVAGVTNPEAATGGEDRESLEAARQNAPLTVFTLDRAVSIQDYADFARAFAGIAKAHALWIPAGPARGVFITVAGIGGAPVLDTSKTYSALLSALRRYGDPLLPIHVVNYRSAMFRVQLSVKVAAEYEPATVLAGVRDLLRTDLGFDRRDFGQGVSVDEVVALAHRVAGVEAVHVSRLYRRGSAVSSLLLPPPFGGLRSGGPRTWLRRPIALARPSLQPRLFAELPVASLTEVPQAAELLTLDADALELTEML